MRFMLFCNPRLFINNVTEQTRKNIYDKKDSQAHHCLRDPRGLNTRTRYALYFLFRFFGTRSVHKDLPISFYLKHLRLVHKKMKKKMKVKNT